MLLLEVVSKAVSVPPAQIGAIGVKVGTVFELIIMVSVAKVAHCPLSGVKI
jgi:hypothetical protein